MRLQTTMALVFLSLLLLGLMACGSRAVSLQTDSAEVDAIAAEIADFEPPAGYSAEFGADFKGYTAVAYSPGDNHSHLYLIQSEDEADGEKLTSMLERLDPGAGDRRTRMTVIDSKAITARGEATTLVISEGVNSEGATYRQAMVVFQGKGGTALLVLSEPIARWRQEAVEAFITSLR